MNTEEQATGCVGAGDYAAYAASKGYPHCAVLDWTSSAGDWTFLVSRDGEEWWHMSQTNNYPQGPGFTRTISGPEDLWPWCEPVYGSEEEAIAEAIAKFLV